MNESTDNPTVSQDFVSRWIEKHELPRQHRDKEDAFVLDLAGAIDSFVKTLPKPVGPLIHEVAIEAVDSDTHSFRETVIEG